MIQLMVIFAYLVRRSGLEIRMRNGKEDSGEVDWERTFPVEKGSVHTSDRYPNLVRLRG